jgi:multicomponent Na+:H+ antiporter subunit D
VIAALVLVPILGAGVSLALIPNRLAQRIITATALAATTGLSIATLAAVEHDTDSIITTRIGGWHPTLGIVLVVDLTAALFLAISLVTITAVAASANWTLVMVGLAVSAGTLLSMTKIWTGAFWGAANDHESPGAPDRGPTATVMATEPTTARTKSMTAAVAALVAVTVLVAVTAGPLVELADRAATLLVDPDPYIDAVLS